MTVNPGFGGQKFIHEVMPKLTRARALLDQRAPRCELEVDGGVDLTTRTHRGGGRRGRARRRNVRVRPPGRAGRRHAGAARGGEARLPARPCSASAPARARASRFSCSQPMRARSVHIASCMTSLVTARWVPPVAAVRSDAGGRGVREGRRARSPPHSCRPAAGSARRPVYVPTKPVARAHSTLFQHGDDFGNLGLHRSARSDRRPGRRCRAPGR